MALSRRQQISLAAIFLIITSVLGWTPLLITVSGLQINVLLVVAIGLVVYWGLWKERDIPGV